MRAVWRRRRCRRRSRCRPRNRPVRRLLARRSRTKAPCACRRRRAPTSAGPERKRLRRHRRCDDDPTSRLRQDAPGNRSAHDGVVAERRQDDRIVTPDKAGEGGDVKMVEVVVAEENEIDRRQVVKGDGRGRDSFWTREGERAGPLGPDGVGDGVEFAGLNENGRVADDGDARCGASRDWHDHRNRRLSRPGRGAGRSDASAGDPQHPVVCRRRSVEEANAVEMVGDGACVIAIARHPGPLSHQAP